MVGFKNLDIEYINELIKEVEEKEKTVELPKIKKHLIRFIDDLGIKEGEDRIPNYLIYYTYKVKWTNYKNDYKMSKIEFFRQLNKLFTSYRLGRQRYYLLDKKSFDLSRETDMDAKFYDKKYQNKKKKIKAVSNKKS